MSGSACEKRERTRTRKVAQLQAPWADGATPEGFCAPSAAFPQGVGAEGTDPFTAHTQSLVPQEGPVDVEAVRESEEGAGALGELGPSSPGTRTIPFRSASFSQVDMTSDGKYVRNARCPITLKPTAFCLLNTSQVYASGSSTLPRTANNAGNTHEKLKFAFASNSSSGSSETEPGEEGSLPPASSDTPPHDGPAHSLPPDDPEFRNWAPSASSLTAPLQGGDEESDASKNNLGENQAQSLLPALRTRKEKVDPDAPPSFESVSSTNALMGQNRNQECSTKPSAEVGDISVVRGEDPQSDPSSSEFKQCASKSEETWPCGSHTEGGSGEWKEKCRGRTASSERNVSAGGGSDSSAGGMVRSSSEEEPPPKKSPQRRLHTKSLHFDVDIGREGEGGGGGSSVSCSGGEDNDQEKDKGSLFRQSSGQSDASDDLPALGSGGERSSCLDIQQQTSSACQEAGTRKLHGISIDPSTCPLTAALALDSTLGGKGGGGASCSAPSYHPHYHHQSPPLANKKEISRANSVSCATFGAGIGTVGEGPGNRTLPPRRYNKRPLRGPYGEMLEAEMNKLIPSRSNKDYDNFEFFRESKSSSPNRSPPGDPPVLSTAVSTPKLSNPLLMASMDDLNLTKQSKHNNPRVRKISAVLQSTHYSLPSAETVTPLTYHQRTASSPSQLLYTVSDTKEATMRQDQTQRRLLEGSPRGHILAEIVDTEKSYVDSLRILVKKYMEPLKSTDVIDSGLVEEIFFQIPSILWHHERLFEALQRRVIDDTQCVGDVLLDTFRQNSLLECYSLFVNNWKNAKGSLKMAAASKPSFSRFLESNARQHKGKLSLDSLLIMPIQRIPRYELLVKELLKHTKPTHEDHSRLTLVLEKIKKFAVHIDCASVDPNDNREIEIEGWGSGLGHLVRQDIVTLFTSAHGRKERALFLFADSLVIASIKRKSTMRKPPSNLSYNSGSNWEGCKFKLLMKISLTEVHLLHEDCEANGLSRSGSACGGVACTSHEEADDLKTIHKMMDLAAMLKCPHAVLDDMLREIAVTLKHHSDNNLDAVDVEVKSNENSDNPEILKIFFGGPDKKSSWLEAFQDTLGKFIRYGFGKLPNVQFLQALPIRKTRAGLQLSCAAPVSLHNKVSKTLEMSDVWVANSDGYVGQICILTLHPEPAITSCNGVCSSRITCIVSVPPPSGAPHSANQYDDPHPPQHQFHALGYESEEDSHRNRAGHKPSTIMEHWSVWLGTEDGGLHVYDCSDSVRVKKNRHKIQHKSPLNCIVYFDSRVFVSLGNGDVAVYSRSANGKGWSVGEPSWVTIGSALNPVTKMVSVNGQIWCAVGSQMKVYGENGGMLELLQSVQVTIDGNQMPRSISILIATEEHIWVAVHGSSILKCYNNSTYESLFEANVALDVSKILAGCDDIIRQHKSACLRITALLMAPDQTLWVGTSAGVILTLSPITPSHKITPLCHGHTGQVRFLTCCTTRDTCTIISGGDGYEEFRPLNPFFNNNANNSNSSPFSQVVNSLMGESSVDASGREDSTNHLLIWKIPKPI